MYFTDYCTYCTVLYCTVLYCSGGEFPNREFPRSGIDGNSSGIPFSKMAFSGNSSEFPYRGGILALQGGFLLTGRYCFIYREVPLHCATKKILTCGFKTRRERALKAAIRGRYEVYRRVVFFSVLPYFAHATDV